MRKALIPIIEAICCIATFALIGVILAWRG